MMVIGLLLFDVWNRRTQNTLRYLKCLELIGMSSTSLSNLRSNQNKWFNMKHVTLFTLKFHSGLNLKKKNKTNQKRFRDRKEIGFWFLSLWTKNVVGLVIWMKTMKQKRIKRISTDNFDLWSPKWNRLFLLWTVQSKVMNKRLVWWFCMK